MGIPFGRYELLRRIAAGGMGEVYLATQAGLEGFEKLLVVKVLLPHLVENEEFITMFLDEARIAARLNHANVAQIFDLGEVEGAYYIAMEYIHGEDVKRIWRKADEESKPVPLPLAVRIAADAAAGLDYAHKATDGNNQPLGIVHRDVSPQNILVTFDGGVKIIDFGIARAANRNVHTATGTLKGKYPYMSPEQATSKNLDHRSDIFALGVVLYEMATNLRLFARDSEIQIIQAVAECDIPRPSESNPAIDEQLEAVILKALSKNPERRQRHITGMGRADAPGAGGLAGPGPAVRLVGAPLLLSSGPLRRPAGRGARAGPAGDLPGPDALRRHRSFSAGAHGPAGGHDGPGGGPGPASHRGDG
ncbi:MAG: serine/threonine-protein kinase [Myxococcota bacterium]